MPRRYRRRRYAIARPLKTAKYSNETYSGSITLGSAADSGSMVIVPTTAVLATRKVKNLTVRMNIFGVTFKLDPQGQSSISREVPFNVWFAVVYVPQGTQPDDIHVAPAPTEDVPVSAISLYEPNQNVIMTGMLNPYQTTTVKTRLARNLNSGDQIMIVYYLNWIAGDISNLGVGIDTLANYAISY